MIKLESADDAASWLRERVTGDLQSDSRDIRPGDGFIAWPGVARDARQFVSAALSAGAGACLQESSAMDHFELPKRSTDTKVAAFDGLKKHAGAVASCFYGNPSEKIKVVAFTGTNGKTSSAWWLAHAISRLDPTDTIPCGLVGTLGVGVLGPGGGDLRSTGLTTPDPVTFQKALRNMVGAGAKACTLEASSIGLAEWRLDGTKIHTAVFTNFTQDHLDYHGDMDSYWEAKKRLFDWPGLGAAVVNIDDPKGAELADYLKAKKHIAVWTVSSKNDARLTALSVRHERQGLTFEVAERNVCATLHSSSVGEYNVDNLLGVVGALRSLGYSLLDSVSACTRLPFVPGRMELQSSDQGPKVFVDYAHTPDALHKALVALRPLANKRQGKLIVVFGCGGHRDRVKRPLMGKIASSNSDIVILTSDNPRGESAHQIMAEIQVGILPGASVELCIDRSEAIQRAIDLARPEDVILVAGKGHETHQEFANGKVPFSDQEEARKALGRWQQLNVSPLTGLSTDLI